MQKYVLGLLCGALMLGMVSGGKLYAHTVLPVVGEFAVMGAASVSAFALETAVSLPFSLHRYVVDSLLEEAVRTGDYWKARACIFWGADVNKKIWGGRSLLLEAVENDDPDMVALLIAYGACVHVYGFWGLPLFFDAVEIGNASIVEAVINEGVFLDMSSASTGNTPLHWASRNGDEVTVRLLVKHGAGINVKNFRGKTPADSARNAGHEALAEWLERI